ncbi:MAG TPA: hypothetical protein EYN34_02065 [Aquifex sp.]|nr:hypothetical protein [Aquifex sp.]
MDRDWKTLTLYALVALTAIDLILWFFKQQTAVFFTLFFLIPLWAVWVWKFVPNEEELEEETPEGDKKG